MNLIFWFQTCFLWSWNVCLIVVAEELDFCETLYLYLPWFAFQWNIQRGTIIKERSFFLTWFLHCWHDNWPISIWAGFFCHCTEMSCVDFEAFHVRSWPDYHSNASVDFFFFFFFMCLRRCWERRGREPKQPLQDKWGKRPVLSGLYSSN